MTRLEIERILREEGAAQHAMVARAQLVSRGVPVDAIDRMVRTGRLAVVQRGVYQLGPVPVGHSAETAAVLACGPGARVSHLSAAAMHGLVDRARAPEAVEVTVPRRRRRRLKGVRIHRVRSLPSDEVMTIAGIPVTTPARTLLDCATVLTERQLEQALAAALRTRLATREAVQAMPKRHARHSGAPQLRRLLAAEGEPAFTRSEGEEKMLEITRIARLPRPELNVTVLGHEVDMVWRSARVVAEVDGYEFHASPKSFTADRRRDAELTAAGYRVLRFTWADVTTDRFATAVRLAQALVRP
jgi:very-short-patch-repair endonuclease